MSDRNLSYHEDMEELTGGVGNYTMSAILVVRSSLCSFFAILFLVSILQCLLQNYKYYFLCDFNFATAVAKL